MQDDETYFSAVIDDNFLSVVLSSEQQLTWRIYSRTIGTLIDQTTIQTPHVKFARLLSSSSLLVIEYESQSLRLWSYHELTFVLAKLKLKLQPEDKYLVQFFPHNVRAVQLKENVVVFAEDHAYLWTIVHLQPHIVNRYYLVHQAKLLVKCLVPFGDRLLIGENKCVDNKLRLQPDAEVSVNGLTWKTAEFQTKLLREQLMHDAARCYLDNR